MASFEEKVAAGRQPCCVLGCRRTFESDGSDETMCGTHWRTISLPLRKRHTRLLRMYRARFGDNGFWAYPAGSPKRIMAVRLAKLCQKAWERCKAQAIERAMGI